MAVLYGFGPLVACEMYASCRTGITMFGIWGLGFQTPRFKEAESALPVLSGMPGTALEVSKLASNPGIPVSKP